MEGEQLLSLIPACTHRNKNTASISLGMSLVTFLYGNFEQTRKKVASGRFYTHSPLADV